MASPARFISAELWFASVLRNQLTREFKRLSNKRMQRFCLLFPPPFPVLLSSSSHFSCFPSYSFSSLFSHLSFFWRQGPVAQAALRLTK